MAKYMVFDVDELNVRPEPGKNNIPIGTISRGTIVEFIKQDQEGGEWFFVKIDSIAGSFNGWVSKKHLELVDSARVQFDIETDLKESKSPLSAEIIDAYLEEIGAGNCMQRIGAPVIAAAQKYRINPTYILAHAIHESDRGRSHICNEKNNLFGFMAFDASAFASAKEFESPAECIDFVMERINTNYLTPGGKYFEKRPCLGNKEFGMNVHYATDPKWGIGIANWGVKIEIFASHFNPPDDKPANRFGIIDAVNIINPEKDYYQPRDITHDGVPETFCNWFVADVLDQLQIKLPRYDTSAGFYPRPHPFYGDLKMTKPFSAAHLNNYFNHGGDGKWKEVAGQSPNKKVVTLANTGKVVVASIPGSPGHIAVVIPGGTGSQVFVAQAGAICSKKLPLEKGFGSFTPGVQFFEYTG
jgi:beta-N-acetylglucosaminidase